MKVSITDKFLWEAYNHLEKINYAISRFPKRRSDFYNLGGIKNPIFEKYRKEKSRKQFADLIRWLKKKNYIKSEQLKSGEAIMLTKEGVNRAIKAKFKVEKNKFEKRKDGKWLMVIFDIPQKYSRARKLLRSVLVNLGYKMFQHSVWITPYDVLDKTEELLQFYSLEHYIKIFLIEKI